MPKKSKSKESNLELSQVVDAIEIGERGELRFTDPEIEERLLNLADHAEESQRAFSGFNFQCPTGDTNNYCPEKLVAVPPRVLGDILKKSKS